MSMKKLYYLMIPVSIFISFFLISSELTSAAKPIEILEITEKAEEADIEIASWSMAIKESIVAFDSIESVRNRVKEIKSREQGFEWSEEQFKGNHYKMVGVKDKGANVDQQISIIYYPMKGNYKLSVNYNIDGEKWSIDVWEQVYNLYKSKMDKHKVFYTVEGHNNSIKKEAQNLIRSMSGKTVDGIYEDNFVSISAYSSKWDVKVPLGDKQAMNMQVANRDRGAHTEVTIGSPIIITEY
ncbi:YwmB family TATA-box binding protein [Halobacillus shinanisalinarum]|uniref:YwmB family TATA-box binding protein n=1 Tax=Halobacillus shinanisalinarum TaxID=2932258 RepID=A0ABY4H0W0_9BACI|nr:YwmB family TATA-box binding protein [Halobacillus shinanisalinarum]UOQ93969.1 YwmB family TATA-box binding protein [Halobacillus shinanisalinarum]